MRESTYSTSLTLSCHFSSAPTDSPMPREGTVTARSITIEWDELACLDRNGVITGYIVEARAGGTLIRTVNVNDGSAREATLSGLTPSTEYIVTLQAVNSADSGPIRSIAIETPGESVWFPLTQYNVLHTRWTQYICHLLNHYISDHLMGTGGGSDCYLILHLLLCH